MSKPKDIHKPYHGRNFNFIVNFITLTLSSKQIHSDQVIKQELLNQFLIETIRRYKIEKYVWRAEKQKNGNIHFHIIMDKYIPWNELRNTWNRIQQKLGYVTRYREGRKEYHKNGFHFDEKHTQKRTYAQQYKAWQKGVKSEWDNPNSIDVHSLSHIGNIKSYLTKYMSKNEDLSEEEKKAYNKLSDEEKQKLDDKIKVAGRLWSCSTNLVNLRGGEGDCSDEIYQELERVKRYDETKVFDSDYYHVYNVSLAILLELKCFNLIASFEDFIRKRFPEDYLRVIT